MPRVTVETFQRLQGGKGYRLRFVDVDGRRKRRVVEAKTFDEAHQIARYLEAQLREVYGGFALDAGPTLGEILQEYIDANADLEMLQTLGPVLKVRLGELASKPVRSLEVRDVVAFRTTLENWDNGRGGKLGPQTIRHYMGVLSRTLEFARNTGVISKNVAVTVSRPPAPPPRERLVTADEFDTLLQVAGQVTTKNRVDALRLAFRLARGAGLRRREIFELAHFDLSRPEFPILRLVKTKNRQPRRVQIAPSLGTMLVKHWPVPFPKLWANYQSMGKTMCAVIRRAQILDMRPHDLRGTWATVRHLHNGWDPARLMKCGGWESGDMLLRYLKLDVVDIGDVSRYVMRLDELPSYLPQR